MDWTNNDDVPWEPGETSLNAGRTLYWLATIVAALLVVFAIADFFIGWALGAPILRIFAFRPRLARPSELAISGPTKAHPCRHPTSTIEITQTAR